MVVLPLRTKVKGPAWSTEEVDVIDEALKYFRANIFFKNYQLQGRFLKTNWIIGPADAVIIYLTLFITHCLKLVEKENNVTEAKKKLLDSSREPVARPNGSSHFSL